MKFLENRLSQAKATGLPLTVFMAAIAYFGLLRFTHVLDFDHDGALARIDIAVSQSFSALRTPTVVKFFSVITAFGTWTTVLAMAVATSVLLWLNDRPQYLVGLWTVLAGNQITVNGLKVIFARGRPDLAYYVETSYSFPSGHSAVSAAFFGFVAFILIRERIVLTAFSVIGGALAILLVGGSRLVLGEHYLSDVLHGFLVGTLWALLGIWLVDRVRLVPAPPQRSPVLRWANVALLVLTAAVVWALADRYQSRLPLSPILIVAP